LGVGTSMAFLPKASSTTLNLNVAGMLETENGKVKTENYFKRKLENFLARR
jgi:hypothetical protein